MQWHALGAAGCGEEDFAIAGAALTTVFFCSTHRAWLGFASLEMQHGEWEELTGTLSAANPKNMADGCGILNIYVDV